MMGGLLQGSLGCRRHKAIMAASHQEVAVRAGLEDARDDAFGQGSAEVGIVEDTESSAFPVGQVDHLGRQLSLAESTTGYEVIVTGHILSHEGVALCG